MYLSIDQSTSGTKVILFDVSGRAVARASREHRQIYPQPGWVEHDLEEIWSNLLTIVREIREQFPETVKKLQIVSITNQRETICVFDKKTGRPLHHAMVWQCRRGESICQQWKQDGLETEIRSKTGLRADAYFSASKLAWLTRNHSALKEQLHHGDALVGTIDTYLIYRLTRGKVYATDHTNASRTLLYDIYKLTWDKTLCELAGLKADSLPGVYDSSGYYGTTDMEGILDQPVPIVGVIGDSQASLFAGGCEKPGQTKATLGTGTSVMTTVGSNPPSRCRGTVAALAWTHQSQPTYAVEGIIHSSAATIEWLKNQLGLFKSADECETLAKTVPDNGGVYLVPAFGGLGAPHWVPEARAAVVGLSTHSTRAHVARAAIESIAYQIADVLDLIRTESGVAPTVLRIDGGASRNRMLLQMIADLTNLPLTVAGISDGSAFGAAMMGAWGTGKTIAHPETDQTIICPSENRNKISRIREGWFRAVKQVLVGQDG